ncbi:MAG: response regulator transcription factor [Gammaproteobacteria bacterium]|jgi:two-component system OmpR family response regulator/two-component system response regulator QseB|nr:response regulator transcription factor [Gammaproteobacteria bacterium]
MSLLLVEDDAELAAALVSALRSEGLSVNHVGRGRDALHVAATEPPEIIILDLGLPDMDGLEVLRDIRQAHADAGIQILILTARSRPDEKVAGLDSGADDYLAKPFDMPELLARLRALSRRRGGGGSNLLAIGDVELDTASQQVTLRGEPVALARREYMLLKVLLENCGKVQTRDSLERRLYSWGEEVASNALEVHIHHLRKKLDSTLIETVRGVGYTIRKP